MKCIILVLSIFIVLLSNKSYSDSYVIDRYSLHYDGDFTVDNQSNYTMKFTMELASLPFEGSTDSVFVSSLRIDQIQNGVRFRCFPTYANVVEYWPLFYVSKTQGTGTLIDMGHCGSAELTGANCEDSAWGFAKYKITIEIIQTGEKYVCYFNCLDSKYNKRNFHGHHYGHDWGFTYYPALPINYRVKLEEASDHTVLDSLSTFAEKEFKVWEIIYGRSEPWERKFYARTVPFGITPEYIDKGHNRNLILGTTVILDTVYNNFGTTDKFGYNTINSGAGFFENYHRYYTRPPIDSTHNDSGNTYTTPAWYYFDGSNFSYGTKITAQSGDTLWLKNRKVLWVTGILSRTPPIEYKGDTMAFKSGSTLRLDPSAELEATRGGVIMYETGANVIWNEHTCNSADEHCSIVINGSGTFTVKDGGFIQINSGGKLVLGDNTTLSFESAISPLILNPGSQVILGNNAKIQFKNGAHLRANGSTFSCPSGSWQGITLENSTYDTIKNCTFSNASTYIDMSLNSSTANEKKIIMGNTFNNGKVKIHNSYNLNFSGNTFNSLTAGGYLLQMSHNLAVLGESVSNINITGNTFKGGAVQMDLDGYASSVTKYYIAGNTFYSSTSLYSVCMLANKISGDFNSNTFADNHFATGIQLTNSNLSFRDNTIKTFSNNNIFFQTLSTGNFSPVVINEKGDLAYYGGFNKFYLDNNITSENMYANIKFSSGNLIFNEMGGNCFNIVNISNNYHILGSQGGPCIEDPLWMTHNYWSALPPKITVTCIGGYADVLTDPVSSCSEYSDLAPSDYIVTYMGDGIYDSVKVVNAPSGDDAGLLNKPSAASYSVPADKLLYGLCVKHNKTRSYLLSSIKAKELIDNFGSSDYIYSALDELYMSYKSMDTISGNTNSLFSELQTYIESKMNQYNSNPRFVEKAYNIYLMCLVMKKQYASAISGYENIMNNHPDPVVRLTASWDRSAVVLLMGQGGSQSSLSFLRKQESRLSDRNPDRIARKIFKSSGEESENGIVSEKYSQEEKSLLNERAVKFNPSTKTEFDEKVSQDKALLLALNNDAPENKTNIIPKRFTLHQNYPNPFNPATTIKYDIPKDAFISLKVYDVLGREIFGVNEFKKAGSHETVFDGSGLASGVYFYSLESNGLKETKKMLLIK